MVQFLERKQLSERAMGKSGRVDRENRILYHVKIAGFNSKNGRRYTREAFEKARDKYENCPIFDGHESSRDSVEAIIGYIKNVRLEADGLYADAHLNPAHPLTDRVVKHAERSPGILGFSHEVVGDSRIDRADGTEVIESIDEVAGVALVCSPATTSGVFEARNNYAASPINRVCEMLVDSAIHRVQHYMDWLKTTNRVLATGPASDCLEKLHGIAADLAITHTSAAALQYLADAGLALSLIGPDVVAALPPDQRADAADCFRMLVQLGGKDPVQWGCAESVDRYAPAFREAAARAAKRLAEGGK